MTTQRDMIAVRPIRVPVRPFYALGVLLDSEDFSSEQSYHRGRLARALKYLFGTGTVAGLRVVWREDTQQIAVEPGLALDPLGRLIEIARPVAIRLRGGPRANDSWFEMQLDEDLNDGWIEGSPRLLVADVFVRWVVCERSRAPAFATGPFDAIDAATPTRVRDGYELALVIRPEARLDRNNPPIPIPDDLRILARQPTDTRENALQWQRLRILQAWRDGSGDWTGRDEDPADAQPLPLEEHVVLQRLSIITFPVVKEPQPGRRIVIESDPTEVGRDPTSVLLARVTIPVSAASPPGDLGQVPTVDNSVRRFIRSSGIYTQPDTGGGA